VHILGIHRIEGDTVLIELELDAQDGKYTADDFGQPGSHQAAYMEHYLSADGTSVISKYFDVPPTESLRLEFFLHKFHFTRKLKTSYGLIEVPAPTPMPARLRQIIRYEPVD
jgi:hypothetical protein